MRLEGSFGAVGLLVLLAIADSGRRQPLLPDETAPPLEDAKCISRATLVETVRHYDFFGARADAAGNSLRQRLLVSTDYQGRQNRFTGQTDWHIEWRACFQMEAQTCRISGVVSKVNVAYTLPRWIDREAAPTALRERWDRYLTSLAVHEKGHGSIALEVARMIETELVGRTAGDCDALNTEGSRLVETVMQRGESMQREYDRATAHGSQQGAHFPF